MIVDDWHGAYRGSWNKVIVPEAFEHPARYAPGLIKRICEHMMAEGWLQPGDVVVDPFAGAACGALEAMRHGLHFVGVELEPRFCRMATQYECPGVSKADWVRWFGRLRRNPALCPACQAAVQVPPEDSTKRKSRRRTARRPGLLEYRRDGKIPWCPPHHYEGNIALWNRRYGRYPGWGTAAVVQGDSRRLSEVLAGQYAGLVSSPPYAQSLMPEMVNAEKYRAIEARYRASHPNIIRPTNAAMVYGSAPGNLGNMPTGDWVAVVSSPPHTPHALGHDAGCVRLDDAEDNRRNLEGCARRAGYGVTPGQLGAMRAGGFYAAVASPPFGQVLGAGHMDSRTRREFVERHGIENTAHVTAIDIGADRGTSYGETDGQLGQMRPDGFDAALSSPPYVHRSNEGMSASFAEWREMCGRDNARPGAQAIAQGYGEAESQLAGSNQFWPAARAIVEQVYQVLKPGAHAVWVLKAYVKDHKIVPFPEQWQQLCEACGFTTLHIHRAWLVDERGTHYTLDGKKERKIVSRIGFFRRLHMKKHPELAINYEIVLCMVKQ